MHDAMDFPTIDHLLNALKAADPEHREAATDELWQLWFHQKGAQGFQDLRQSQSLMDKGYFTDAEALLSQVIADLRKILRLSRQQSLQVPGRMEQSLSEHMAVFAALQARDNSGAEAAMRTHLLRQRDALRELTRQQPKGLKP